MEKITPTVLVKDSLSAPHQQTTIEAKLFAKGLLKDSPLGGEPVELLVKGIVSATAMTGGDGRAFLSFIPKGKDILPIQVRTGSSPRVSSGEGEAHLVVWERRTPILIVELTALMEDVHAETPVSRLVPRIDPEARPIADAADELGKLTQFYYGVIYVVTVPAGADVFVTSVEARTWLSTHKFPRGFVLALSGGEDALGAKIDELHQAGWKSAKTGIGRSKAFAETFLKRRLEAIIVPEPPVGEVPRKGKVAKDWKDVRKKL
ncbi:MAG TPA: hypothetical protein VFH05_10810 [Nitrospira sp.]|nr:hypothetical protein [Nitrospira sp.]